MTGSSLRLATILWLLGDDGDIGTPAVQGVPIPQIFDFLTCECTVPGQDAQIEGYLASHLCFHPPPTEVVSSGRTQLIRAALQCKDQGCSY